MKNEDKIIELLAEMVQKQDQMAQNQAETNRRLESLEKTTNDRFERVEKAIAKLNVQTKENTRAIVKLADKVEDYAKHEERIQKLERVVFK